MAPAGTRRALRGTPRLATDLTERPSAAAWDRRRFLALLAIWLLVLASLVSWRRGSIYSGGLDTTVVAKAVLALVAVGAALVLWRLAPVRRPLSPYPALFVAAIVAVSLIGATFTVAVVPNAVLAVRIGLLAVTILLLLSATDTVPAVASLLTAMGIIGVLAAASGIGSIHRTGTQAGRLGGGIPPLEPNELAGLLLPVAVTLAVIVARRRLRTWALPGLAVLAGIIVATGSRTALGLLVLGAVIALFTAGRVSRRTALILLASVVVLVALLTFTPVLTNLVLRGQGIERLLSLNARTISWGAVLALPHDQWTWWFGHGLSMKTIPVVGQYWKTQVFDSSWFSSIAQDGVVGTVLLVIYALGTVVALARRTAMRPWALPLVVTMLLWSIVENGLIESSATFTLFFLLATAAWPARRSIAAPGPEDDEADVAPERVLTLS